MILCPIQAVPAVSAEVWIGRLAKEIADLGFRSLPIPVRTASAQRELLQQGAETGAGLAKKAEVVV